MTPLAADFQAVFAREPLDLAAGALVIARLEYPHLDPRPSLRQLDALGRRAADVTGPSADPVRARVARLNALLFDDEGFAGNRVHYDDFRNSLLNVVLDRRLGIPITLGLIYIEVARRAGIDVQGIAFPGHFLLSVPTDAAPALILDPFAAGEELDEAGCRALLTRVFGEDAAFDVRLLRPCTPRQLLLRLLNNLKRTYIEVLAFGQARRVTDLLLAGDPTLLAELRDRGLLSYQLDDYPAALRDLEAYLRLHTRADAEDEEHEQIRQHVQALRRRVASLN